MGNIYPVNGENAAKELVGVRYLLLGTPNVPPIGVRTHNLPSWETRNTSSTHNLTFTFRAFIHFRHLYISIYIGGGLSSYIQPKAALGTTHSASVTIYIYIYIYITVGTVRIFIEPSDNHKVN